MHTRVATSLMLLATTKQATHIVLQLVVVVGTPWGSKWGLMTWVLASGLATTMTPPAHTRPCECTSKLQRLHSAVMTLRLPQWIAVTPHKTPHPTRLQCGAARPVSVCPALTPAPLWAVADGDSTTIVVAATRVAARD